MNKLLSPLAIFLLAMPVAAQQKGAPDEQTPTDIPFRVIEQTQINRGDHKIILNRVAPPVLPEKRAAVPQTTAPLSTEAMQTALRQERKKSAVLFLSATVYDRQVTLLRWFGEGGEIRAFSNIDFNFLAGLGQIETDDTVYAIFMGLGNETREAVAERNRAGVEPIPPLSQFSPVRAEYFVVVDKSKPATAEVGLPQFDGYLLEGVVG